jgi:LysM repeat protein
VSIEAIQAANNMGSSTLITIGQILAIPGGVPGEPPGNAPQIYVVQSGDTAFSIAQRFNTTVDAIAWANQLVNPWNIYGGQELVIPEGDETGSSPAGGGVHVVQPGESLYSIATAYNTTVWAIAVANNLPNPQVIYVGERLLIP